MKLFLVSRYDELYPDRNDLSVVVAETPEALYCGYPGNRYDIEQTIEVVEKYKLSEEEGDGIGNQ